MALDQWLEYIKENNDPDYYKNIIVHHKELVNLFLSESNTTLCSKLGLNPQQLSTVKKLLATLNTNFIVTLKG